MLQLATISAHKNSKFLQEYCMTRVVTRQVVKWVNLSSHQCTCHHWLRRFQAHVQQQEIESTHTQAALGWLLLPLQISCCKLSSNFPSDESHNALHVFLSLLALLPLSGVHTWYSSPISFVALRSAAHGLSGPANVLSTTPNADLFLYHCHHSTNHLNLLANPHACSSRCTFPSSRSLPSFSVMVLASLMIS